MTIGWVGDCVAIQVVGDECRRLTTPHDTSNYFERERLAKFGVGVEGNYFGGIIQISRAIGDHRLRSIGVCAEPSVISAAIPKGRSWIVLASDGLLRSIPNVRSVGRVVSDARNTQVAADNLIQRVIGNQGDDNVTVMVVQFDN